MLGVIRKRDVLAHPRVTIRCFGWRVFLRTLVAGRNQTFLSLLMESEILEARCVQVPKLVDRCIQLELRARRLYERIARRFSENEAARALFTTLARQEEEHAQLLGLSREAARRGRWRPKHFDPFAEVIPRLEQRMADAESSLDRLRTVGDALRLAVDIESSEVNRVYQGIVAASESEFVRALEKFHGATESHISYLCREAPGIDPALDEACRSLGQS